MQRVEVPVTDAGIRWVERRWRAMGSDAHCLVATEDEHVVSDAIDQLERLERSWSRFRVDSELVTLNDSPHEEVVVSPTLADAVRRAVIAWELTDGWFDPTVLDALEVAGYRHSFADDTTARGVWPERRAAPTPADVSVDVERCIVRRPPGLRIDLGGLGKGLAADLIATQLIDAGAIACCVSLGGDVRVAGQAPEGGWRIPVERPDRTALGAPGPTWFDATLGHGAIVTSTTRLRRWRTIDGHDAHHLIDPHSGRPSRRRDLRGGGRRRGMVGRVARQGRAARGTCRGSTAAGPPWRPGLARTGRRTPAGGCRGIDARHPSATPPGAIDRSVDATA